METRTFSTLYLALLKEPAIKNAADLIVYGASVTGDMTIFSVCKLDSFTTLLLLFYWFYALYQFVLSSDEDKQEYYAALQQYDEAEELSMLCHFLKGRYLCRRSGLGRIYRRKLNG